MKWTLTLAVVLLLGCGTSNAPDTPGSDLGQGAAAGDASSEEPTPTFDPAEWLTHEAGPFTVPAHEERFFCFSFTLTEDISFDELVLESRPVVHHVVYSMTSSPDPEGFFECDVLFQNNWVPVFVAGTGDATLAMPDGAGHVLEAGTQLTMQLHLLNATLEDVTETIPIHLHRMTETPSKPVEVVIFGSMNIALPPAQASDVVGSCASDSDMNIFSVFPHMHLLGKSLVVETGPDEDHLTEIFRRDPYDFDDQHLEPLELAIAAGDSVRVTCSYDNYLDETVTFGESTTNEMCFLVGFATEASHQLAGCISGTGGAGNFIPEGCGDDPPNDIGLGAACTPGGGECGEDLLCTEDFEQIQGAEVCIGFGCSSAAECGEGGVCCGIAAAGDLTICLPPSCVFSICDVLP
jgi:hypothetical protein